MELRCENTDFPQVTTPSVVIVLPDGNKRAAVEADGNYQLSGEEKYLIFENALDARKFAVKAADAKTYDEFNIYDADGIFVERVVGKNRPPSQETLIHEARARIMWGEKPDEVSVWMAENGVEQQRIDDVLAICQKERAGNIRSQGIAEIVMGVPIMAVAPLCWFFMANAGIFSGRIAGLCFMVSVYGLYRFARGLGWLLLGGKVRGSLSDLES